ALIELQQVAGRVDGVVLSDPARVQLLELHARALSAAGGPLAHPPHPPAALPDGSRLRLTVSPEPGAVTTVRSPAGTLRLHDLVLELA
ncbi:MAG: DUF2397 family protein, partial [Pseudorhodobacter sp.]|nr:DUF2397 family protein [Frankiaceae bacterium]